MKELLTMFITFAKIGTMTFGGGYAMLPILQRELVEKKGWTTDEELTDYFAIGQCTPGVIAVNTATFIGYKKRGIPGSIFATLGICFPAMVIITIIAAFVQNFAELDVVKNAFAGVRVCVCVLILNSVIKLWKSAVKDKTGMIIFGIVFIIAVFLDIPTALVVLAAGLTGYIIKRIRREAAK